MKYTQVYIWRGYALGYYWLRKNLVIELINSEGNYWRGKKFNRFFWLSFVPASKKMEFFTRSKCLPSRKQWRLVASSKKATKLDCIWIQNWNRRKRTKFKMEHAHTSFSALSPLEPSAIKIAKQSMGNLFLSRCFQWEKSWFLLRIVIVGFVDHKYIARMTRTSEQANRL